MATIDALTGPSLMPRSGKTPTSAVILVHGYGANGADLIGLAPAFAEVLPDTAFYSPNAPQSLGGFSGAYQWFALEGFDPAAIGADPNRMIDVYKKMRTGAAQAAAVLNRYIDQVLATHKLEPGRLALVGFSQGTMMSLHVGLRRPKQIGGIVGFSGALTGADVLAAQIVTRPPVALVHGDADPILPVQSMTEAARVLKSVDVPVTTHAVAGLQHGIDGEAAHYGTTFLRKILG
jgi:phospholipase/carboxylesterase